MNYKLVAENIIKQVGGKENVKNVAHCLTRLRLTLTDNDKVNEDGLINVDGVIKVVKQSGQIQVVIGTAVSSVYKEFVHLGDFNTKGNIERKQTNKKETIVNQIFRFISSSFIAVLPAIIAGGIVKAFLTIMTLIGLIDTTGSLYQLLTFMGNTPFYFLPVLIAYGVAKHQGSSVALALTCSAFLLLPDLQTALSEGIDIIGLKVANVSYSSTVFPAFLGTFCLKYIENFFNKYIPNVIKTTFQPLCVVLVAVPLYLLIIGPFGYYVGNALQDVVLFLYDSYGWLTVTLLAILMPFLVATGIHTAALVPLVIATNAAQGTEGIILPAMFCANMAIASSCLAVSFFSKNNRTKADAFPAAVTAFLGITEPGLYGVSIRLKMPLYCGCIAAGLGGLYAGISSLYTTTLSASLLSYIGFIGDNNAVNLINGIIVGVIVVVCSFIFTVLAYKSNKVVDEFDEV